MAHIIPRRDHVFRFKIQSPVSGNAQYRIGWVRDSIRYNTPYYDLMLTSGGPGLQKPIEIDINNHGTHKSKWADEPEDKISYITDLHIDFKDLPTLVEGQYFTIDYIKLDINGLFAVSVGEDPNRKNYEVIPIIVQESNESQQRLYDIEKYNLVTSDFVSIKDELKSDPSEGAREDWYNIHLFKVTPPSVMSHE